MSKISKPILVLIAIVVLALLVLVFDPTAPSGADAGKNETPQTQTTENPFGEMK